MLIVSNVMETYWLTVNIVNNIHVYLMVVLTLKRYLVVIVMNIHVSKMIVHSLYSLFVSMLFVIAVVVQAIHV